MTVPALAFPDPRAAVATAVRGLLAGRPEDYADDVVVGTRIPTDRDLEARATPLVVIQQDGPAEILSRVRCRTPIRAMVWHDTDDETWDLAQLVHGLITAHRSSTVRAVSPELPPEAAADPDTGAPMCAFTVSVTTGAHTI